MKEKYIREHDASEGMALGCGGVFVIIWLSLLIGVLIGTPAGEMVAVLVFVILLTALLIIGASLEKGSFDADDTQVTFSCLGRKKVIRYGEIRNMKLERHNRTYNTRTGMTRYYVETLTINAKENTYVFSAKMELDYDVVAMDPDDLKRQFENSKFSKLKTHIEEHIPIMQID